ncbi:DDE-type integrase/transposase/recombinase [Crenobacter sp. SG2305]|nr:DDE-type integrase/transposase/recombinase [Crenobacter sp. SG2305]MDN0084641.1 DDE-type integrase/transposase/recombinase [Crenobacter sp. SG2305]
MDETDILIKGQWKYLYRAVDQESGLDAYEKATAYFAKKSQ